MKKETAKKLKAIVCSQLDSWADKSFTGAKDFEALFYALGCLSKIISIEAMERTIGKETCDCDDYNSKESADTEKDSTRMEIASMLKTADEKKLETLKKLMQVI